MHWNIILLYSMLTDHLVRCRQQNITTLSHIHIIFFIRCIEVAGRKQEMQATQCKSVKMKDKQSVSVDVYDQNFASVLVQVLHIICSEDDVTLHTVGNNLHHIELQMDHDEGGIMDRVSKELRKICTRNSPKLASYNSDIMKPCGMVE